jgi:hypothetical protein
VQVDREAACADVRRAFANVSAPVAIEDMRSVRYTGDDSYELASALLGKRWTDVPIEVLFRHRESLGTLSAAAYRAYLPAYLLAAIASDDPLDRYGPDLRHYLLSTLVQSSHDDHRAAEIRERLSLLDADQRVAVAHVLRYLEARWNSFEAGEVLRTWSPA